MSVAQPHAPVRARTALRSRLRAGGRASAAADGPWRGWGTALAALLVSRLVVLAAGAGSVAAWGVEPGRGAFDPPGRTAPFGPTADALLAPFARWDSVWYLDIVADGYPATGVPGRPAFFPLYPLLVRAVAPVVGSAALGGVVVSLACLLGALVVVHRLAEREAGPRAARTAVWVVALFPGGLWLSAVYSEGLFLLLSAACVLAARRERWATAAALGALAATTRSAGVLLVVPLAVTWWELHGRRPGGAPGPRTPLVRHLRIRARARPAGLLAAAAVPLGLVAFGLGLGVLGHDVRAPIEAQALWSRESVGPLRGVADAVGAAWADVVRLLRTGGTGPLAVGGLGDLALLGTLVVAVAAVVGTWRRLPPAYGAYATAALLLPLSTPVPAQPLMSLPRFVGVLFPLALWAAIVLARAPRPVRVGAAVGSAVVLGLLSAAVARWTWIA